MKRARKSCGSAKKLLLNTTLPRPTVPVQRAAQLIAVLHGEVLEKLSERNLGCFMLDVRLKADARGRQEGVRTGGG